MIARALITLLLVALDPAAGSADAIFATRTIRPQEVIYAEDIVLRRVHSEGAVDDLRDAIGQEAQVALYAGRVIRQGDIGPPAIAERNEILPLTFQVGLIEITTEGRALARGSAGETIRVMNLSSRRTVNATLTEDGRARVAP